MGNPLTRCPDCGRLFGARRGAIRCSACEDERTEQIPPSQNSPVSPVSRSLEIPIPASDSALRHGSDALDEPSIVVGELDADRLCFRCGKQPVQAGSDFCLDCRLILNRAFGEATDELFSKFAAIEYEPRVPHAVNTAEMVSALRDKRARSGPRVEDLAPQRGLI